MSTFFHNALRAVASAMEIPVVILLLLLLAFAVFSIGWWAVEYWTERRHMKICLSQLIDVLQSGTTDAEKEIENSGLLHRQKTALVELCRHKELDKGTRESLAANLLEKEHAYYDRFLKLTELAAKLGPMLGLLGTLIPLGPGILALGQGDTYTLSQSLLTAFDTTIAGLLAAAVCLVISTVRRRWYNEYLADLETLFDCLLQREL